MTAADLTPDALARLEAKLLADLEMVRKVRALLAEHQVSPADVAAAPEAGAAGPPATATATTMDTPHAPPRPMAEVLMECLAAMGDRPFAPQDFKDRMRSLTKRWPDDKEVKMFLNRMIRQGSVVVHEVRKGRPGSLYRSLLPAPGPSASAADGGESAAASA